MFREWGIGEWIVVLLAIMLLFGAKRIPDLARSLGRSISEFKKGREEGVPPQTTTPRPDETAKGKDAPDKRANG
jgi:sec-independent protein translocase protein TatA